MIPYLLEFSSCVLMNEMFRNFMNLTIINYITVPDIQYNHEWSKHGYSISIPTEYFFLNIYYSQYEKHFLFDTIKIHPEQALAAVEAQMELHELKAWSSNVATVVDQPIEDYK